jgi:hypothetical protein
MPDTDIDTAILAKLNDGRLGTDNGRHRRADRIVSLEINIIRIDSQKEIMFEEAGERSGAEQHYSFVNCGSLTEKRDYEETITKEHSAEVEMTNVVKTSTSFTGKLTTSCKFPLDGMDIGIGTEGTAAFSKDFTVTDRNKQTNSVKTNEVQRWSLEVPSHTQVIYKIATVNGTKKIQFSGVVVVKGVFHYVTDNVWDQNAIIENALGNEKDRTFDFTGILTTVNFVRVDISKTEVPVTADDCAARAKAIPVDKQKDLVMLDREIGQQRFEAAKAASKK